jgi:hypothetical protein
MTGFSIGGLGLEGPDISSIIAEPIVASSSYVAPNGDRYVAPNGDRYVQPPV